MAYVRVEHFWPLVDGTGRGYRQILPDFKQDRIKVKRQHVTRFLHLWRRKTIQNHETEEETEETADYGGGL